MNASYNLPSDTPQHIRDIQNAIVLQKSPLERLQMCAELTEFSLNMLRRHIIATHPGIDEGRLKFEMIKALYHDCYSDEEMARIEKHFMALAGL